MLLAGDIGGTKTVLGVFTAGKGPHAPLVQATFPSAEYPSLDAFVREFLARAEQRMERAVFGVAGPVVAGRVTVTNLPWMLDEAQLRAELSMSSVRLINDLTALAYAVPHLGPDDLATLNEGQPVEGGAIAIVAPGTGLGEAYLVWDGRRYNPCASEGGHADYAPATLGEVELLRYLLERVEHVSYEHVCSGNGLPHIYAYLRDSGRAAEPGWLSAQLAAAEDPTPVIVNTALDRREGCEICVATLDTFVSILGSEAGNLALKVLATGGVYLGGGIPPRILPALRDGRFMEAFRRKGRMAGLLADVPVHVILHGGATLLGAALCGLESV